MAIWRRSPTSHFPWSAKAIPGSAAQRIYGRRSAPRAGIAPFVLEAEEGLSLINGTQAHTAIAALALAVEPARSGTRRTIAGAASLEALLGTPDAFDARIHEARGQTGQVESAALLRESSRPAATIRESHRTGDPRVQDAYALRCMPQVHGPVLDAIVVCRGRDRRGSSTRRRTIRSCSKTATMLSGGNFHGQAVAMALDFLAIAMTNLATMSRAAHRPARPSRHERRAAALSRARRRASTPGS